MVSKTDKLRGKGEAYGPWQNGQQTVYRVYAVEPTVLYVSVLGNRAEGEHYRPAEHEPLSPPFPLPIDRVISLYLYPQAIAPDHHPWPHRQPRVDLGPGPYA